MQPFTSTEADHSAQKCLSLPEFQFVEPRRDAFSIELTPDFTIQNPLEMRARALPTLAAGDSKIMADQIYGMDGNGHILMLNAQNQLIIDQQYQMLMDIAKLKDEIPLSRTPSGHFSQANQIIMPGFYSDSKLHGVGNPINDGGDQLQNNDLNRGSIDDLSGGLNQMIGSEMQNIINDSGSSNVNEMGAMQDKVQMHRIEMVAPPDIHQMISNSGLLDIINSSPFIEDLTTSQFGENVTTRSLAASYTFNPSPSHLSEEISNSPHNPFTEGAYTPGAANFPSHALVTNDSLLSSPSNAVVIAELHNQVESIMEQLSNANNVATKALQGYNSSKSTIEAQQIVIHDTIANSQKLKTVFEQKEREYIARILILEKELQIERQRNSKPLEATYGQMLAEILPVTQLMTVAPDIPQYMDYMATPEIFNGLIDAPQSSTNVITMDPFFRLDMVDLSIPSTVIIEPSSTSLTTIAPVITAKKGRWSSDEDEELLMHFNELLPSCSMADEKIVFWNKIGDRMLKTINNDGLVEFSGRSGIQCQARYHETLDPTLKRTRWSNDEIELLKVCHDEYGKQWVKISERIEGRTQRQCRARWLSLRTKQMRDAPLENVVDDEEMPTCDENECDSDADDDMLNNEE